MGCRAVIHILGQSGITGGSLRTTQDDNCGDDDDDGDGDEYDRSELKDSLLLTQDDNGCDDHDIDGDVYNGGQLRDLLRPTQDDNSGDDHDDFTTPRHHQSNNGS